MKSVAACTAGDPFLETSSFKTKNMKEKFTKRRRIGTGAVSVFALVLSLSLMSSSHREAPLIANDPLADNTDLYVFRCPDLPDKINIIADYIPFELPQG